jgi:hypothetical protein
LNRIQYSSIKYAIIYNIQDACPVLKSKLQYLSENEVRNIQSSSSKCLSLRDN